MEIGFVKNKKQTADDCTDPQVTQLHVVLELNKIGCFLMFLTGNAVLFAVFNRAEPLL